MNVRINQPRYHDRVFARFNNLATINDVIEITNRSDLLIVDVNRRWTDSITRHHGSPTNDQTRRRHCELKTRRRWRQIRSEVGLVQAKHLFICHGDCAIHNRKHEEHSDVTQQQAKKTY
jgi:hypothetical protein